MDFDVWHNHCISDLLWRCWDWCDWHQTETQPQSQLHSKRTWPSDAVAWISVSVIFNSIREHINIYLQYAHNYIHKYREKQRRARCSFCIGLSGLAPICTCPCATAQMGANNFSRQSLPHTPSSNTSPSCRSQDIMKVLKLIREHMRPTMHVLHGHMTQGIPRLKLTWIKPTGLHCGESQHQTALGRTQFCFHIGQVWSIYVNLMRQVGQWKLKSVKPSLKVYC